MANLIIKSSADNLVLKGSGQTGSDTAITVGATGTTTFAENATLSGTANNFGTVTAGTIASGVTGGAGLSDVPKMNFHEQWGLNSVFSGANTSGIAGWTEFGNYGAGAMVCDGSGNWTFPSTGYYKIEMKWSWNNGNSNTTPTAWIEGIINTRISGTTAVVDYQYGNWSNNSGTDYQTAFGSYIYDVTDTTTHKIVVGTQGAATVQTASGKQNTTITFLRLGDT